MVLKTKAIIHLCKITLSFIPSRRTLKEEYDKIPSRAKAMRAGTAGNSKAGSVVRSMRHIGRCLSAEQKVIIRDIIF
jgi:hypothetical protein